MTPTLPLVLPATKPWHRVNKAIEIKYAMPCSSFACSSRGNIAFIHALSYPTYSSDKYVLTNDCKSIIGILLLLCAYRTNPKV